MKRYIKVISAILIFTLCFTFIFTGCAEELTPIDLSTTYEPLSGEYQSYLYDNPDRGYRTEMLLHFKPSADGTEKDFRTMIIEEGETVNKDKIDRIFDIYFPGHLEYQSKSVIFYTLFDGYNKGDIPKEVFDLLDYAFDICRTRKVRVIFRVSYSNLLLNHHLSEENKTKLAEKCADQETMIRHMKDFSALLGRNKDVVHKVGAGFIGFMGEMGEVYQWPSVDFNVIIKNIIEIMCVPNGIEYSARTPQMLQEFLETYPNYEYESIIGLCNETIWGEQERQGWAPMSGLQWHSENGLWEYICARAAYTPQSGELLVNESYLNLNNYRPVKGIEVAAQLAHHRYNIFSQWHTLGENVHEDHVMRRWIETETVFASDLDAKGLIYDPAWFYDEDGIEIIRNPYEYIRDHLGYKLVAENSNLKGSLGKGGSLSVDMTFKNYGFAAPFYLESGFMLLNEDLEVVSSVKSGNPDEWISLPADYFVEDKTESVLKDVITYTISATLESPAEPGKYFVAFYLRNDLDDYAALSNADESVSYEENKYNILHTVVIE